MGDTEYVRPAGDVSYLVMCGGVDREPIHSTLDERHAHELATAHEHQHQCRPWVQYPLEHDAHA